MMARKYKIRLTKILSLIVVLLLLIFFYLALKSDTFLVKNIVVTTDYNVNANPGLIEILENTRNKNIFFINGKIIAEQIKATDLKINEVLVQKRFPGKILVEIKNRQAVAVIPLAGKFFLVDKDGLVFDEKKEISGLPILELSLQNISLGSRIDNRYKSIFLIIDLLKGKEEVSRVWPTGQDFQIQTREGTLILFPFQDETQVKLNALQTILDRFRIEGKRPAKIDLRFEKPVVSF